MSKEIDWQKFQQDNNLTNEQFEREMMKVAGDCMIALLERVSDTRLTAKHVVGDETYLLRFSKQ